MRGRGSQRELREEQARPFGVADRLVVLKKPGNAGGGKEPSFKSMWKVAKEARLGNLETPPSVRKLQTALHAKAKAEPEYRFYLLYDKVYRADILSLAYARCKANDGAAGVDGQTFENIEAYGKNDRTSVDREIAGHRDGWSESMAWGTGARAQGQDLSTASGQTGLHSEAEQQENATSGDRDDTRPGCSDGGDAGA